MKIKAVLASLLCLAPFTFAHANPCTDPGEPDDMIHCSWINGMGDDFHNGRYIKAVVPNEGSLTACTNYGDESTVSASDNPSVGPNSVEYFICSDSTGTNCAPIGVDNYIVSQSPVTQQYTATPKITMLTISKTLMDAFPKCAPFRR